MTIQPVSIPLTNKHNRLIFTNLVLILDQDDFLIHISKIRNCWNLVDELTEPKNLNAWLTEYHPEFTLTSYAADILNQVPERLEIDSLHKNLDDYEVHSRNIELAKLDRCDLEIEILLKRFNIPNSLKRIILQSVICGVLEESDYADLKLDKIRIRSNEWLYEDVNLGLRFIKFGEVDTKNDIVRDRDWYWLRKSGKPYKEIASEDPLYKKSMGLGNYADQIKDRVKAYRTFLRQGVVWATP